MTRRLALLVEKQILKEEFQFPFTVWKFDLFNINKMVS